MVRREESVPFAFVAESGHFRSNVTPPRHRPSRTDMAGRVLLGVVAVAGLVGSLLLGVPALENPQPQDGGPDHPSAAESR
ncbi:hypothetical protein [Streptomyces sp. CNQ085]|uniref:hypothetical protein n=1 Tax=Streptomyces sp. CNQ085 TaxID=2886944 RepID=UPI001F509CF9|nr:hypothetical protein [Streptomyces sp. CNQ085]MCI0384845.1 hypothetical protein [Streptomyces sp. CNQ085]